MQKGQLVSYYTAEIIASVPFDISLVLFVLSVHFHVCGNPSRYESI